ncbi:hypothetical protein SGUI_1432 [Serinicoccus hydrothermalis]|uniref:Thioredoxin n=1 Tax=Serinicoccus hydrothermalis TaxID=1758689 RepID=A0A1B1NBL0_9MICO|nr:hypothetical protein SGUI_1432 [Serinicoccus hydrothermalis]
MVRTQVEDVVVRDIDAERAGGEMGQAEHDRWTTEVPVLLVDEKVVARWRVEPAELRSALSRARRAGRRP